MDEVIFYISKLVGEGGDFNQALLEAANLLPEYYRQSFLTVASKANLHEDPVWGLWLMMEEGILTETNFALLAEKQ